MLRFDGRRLKQNGDDNDLRDFVGELLRASPGYGQPIPRDSGSVDGGIDLYCDREGLVVECKFIGANVKDESARVDQEWEKVSDKFKRTLATRDERATPTRAPYEPWADNKRPIKRYIFATSARLANETRQRDLAAIIQDFFRDSIATRSGYEHLRNIAVEVIDWTNINTRLADHPTLVFKWLKQWPSGFSELDDRSPSGFRAFLHGKHLHYLARDSWQPPAGLRHPWTETSLVEELSQSEARDPVVVLIGQGGVGKTRLGLETARRMRKLGWWTIHCDGLRTTTAGLRQLLEESSTSVRALLFVDYLETWPGFEAFANDVLDLNQSSGHQVRVIATCRASYRDRLPSFIKARNVGGDFGIEATYSEAVTLHILKKLGAGDIENLAQKCRHNFALAAFLLFLKQERPEEFAAEISALREEPSFEAWIVKRLQNAGLRDLHIVAAMLAACEFPATIFDELAKAHGGVADDLRRVLVADRWIERREPAERSTDGPVWAVFHDIFADVVLSRSLDITPDPDDTIDRLLERAVVNGVFRQTFTALGRLKQNKTISEVNWRPRLFELERRSPGTLASHARLLLASALLTPETRLALIVANDDLRDAIASDPACDVGIALTAAALSNASDVQQDDVDRVFLPLLDGALAHAQPGNLVVRLAFEARPDRYREAARQWIVNRPRLFQTHFLLKAWLDQSVMQIKAASPEGVAHVEVVREAVNDWLTTQATLAHASFVLASWLEAAAAIGGERVVEMVMMAEGHVATWLAHRDHATSFEAEFVYKAWLNAAAAIGDGRAVEMVTAVEDHVIGWLSFHDHTISDEARFVYEGWLDAAAAIGGERAVEMVTAIEDYVAAWLAHRDHATSDAAGFVYEAWLDAAATIKGERAVEMVTAIEDHVVEWLAQRDHATSYEARFVYKSWLDVVAVVGGERAIEMIALVEARVTAWLAQRDHAISDEARFAYKAWLDAAAAIGGEHAVKMVAAVEDHVAAWLAHRDHAASDEAQFIYKAWLEAAHGAQLRRFSNELLAWILAHQDDDNCDFVLESWLDKHLEFDPVAEPCFRAVRRLYNKRHCAFILKHVVRQKKLPEDVFLAALCWCAQFPDHEDALNRLGPLVGINQAIIVGAAQLTRITAKVLYHTNVDSLIVDPYKLAAARATLGSLFSIGESFTPAEKLARVYFIRWLRDGRIFRHSQPTVQAGRTTPVFDQKKSLVEALLTLMTHGEFAPATNSEDEATLAKFCDWVGQWEALNQVAIAGLVEELTDRFGLPHLWQRMLPREQNNLDSVADQFDAASPA
jgi:hypothetical protein